MASAGKRRGARGGNIDRRWPPMTNGGRDGRWGILCRTLNEDPRKRHFAIAAFGALPYASYYGKKIEKERRMFPRNHYRLVLRIVALPSVLCLMLLWSCSRGDQEREKAEAKAPEAPSLMVQAKPPVVADVPVYGEYVGRTAAKENVEIRARVEGYLKERLFTEGSLVKKGALLFVIEPRQYQENLQKARAELTRQQALLGKAQTDLSRFETLYKQRAVSRDEYDTRLTNQRELAANIESAKAAVDTAERDLGYTKIQAPIAGRIGKGLVNVGNLVGKGDNTLLAEISSTDPMA